MSVTLCNAGFAGELLDRMLGLNQCDCACGTWRGPCNACVGPKCCCPEPVCCGSSCCASRCCEKPCCAPCCAKPCCEKPCCEKPCCEPKCHKLYRRPLIEFLENLFCGDDCCCGSPCLLVRPAASGCCTRAAASRLAATARRPPASAPLRQGLGAGTGPGSQAAAAGASRQVRSVRRLFLPWAADSGVGSPVLFLDRQRARTARRSVRPATTSRTLLAS